MCEVGPIDCDTNAMCLDRDGGYDCECSTGYSGNGTYCEGIIASFPFISMLQSYISSSDIDECTSGNDTCHINATCINTAGSYDCECLSGFMGDGFNCSSEYVLNPFLNSTTWYLLHVISFNFCLITLDTKSCPYY